MYIQKHFEATDPAVLQALMREHPLATWVTQGDGELIVNHVPLLLHAGEGPHGTLRGHLPRANSASTAFSRTVNSVFVFHGVQAYITPSWYASKQEHGKVVPTWNYAVVHAHGMPRIIEDKTWLLAHLQALTDEHESGRDLPWKVTDAPPDFIDRTMDALVGIEIPIARLEGKWKVSQNRGEADRRGVIAGLRGATGGGDASRDMAALVEHCLSLNRPSRRTP